MLWEINVVRVAMGPGHINTATTPPAPAPRNLLSHTLRISAGKRCGEMRGRRADLTGLSFGNLTVLPFSHRTLNGNMMWLCSCTCEARVWKRADRLLQGKVKSCCPQHRWSLRKRT